MIILLASVQLQEDWTGTKYSADKFKMVHMEKDKF